MTEMALRSLETDGGSDTVIGRGTVFRGALNVVHSIQVHGILKGSRLTTEKALIVGPEGDVKAEVIEVGEAIISGKVAGAIKARRQVYLAASGVFEGRIETPKLVIEVGAVLKEKAVSQPSEAGEEDTPSAG